MEFALTYIKKVLLLEKDFFSEKWSLLTKFFLFSSIFSLSMIFSFYFLHPAYLQLKNLKATQVILEQKWQQLSRQKEQFHQLQMQLNILQKNYHIYLEILNYKSNLPKLLEKLTLLIKNQNLILLNLSPQNHLTIMDLERQTIFLEMLGTEKSVINFLQLIMHQSWLINPTQLQLRRMPSGIFLQVTIELYYDPT